MNKRLIAAALAMASMPEAAFAARVVGSAYGRKAVRGQHTVTEENGNRVDRSERINYDRSKYIPGNGPDHRLGKSNPECAKRSDR